MLVVFRSRRCQRTPLGLVSGFLQHMEPRPYRTQRVQPIALGRRGPLNSRVRLPSLPLSHEHRSPTWPDLLNAVDSPEEVLSVVKNFLATWDPFELNALPLECKPPAYFLQPEDVVSFAFTVVQHHCGLGSGDPGTFRMATFFAHAARRIATLTRRTPAGAH